MISRLVVMVTLMMAMTSCLAMPQFDDISQAPMSSDGTKIATKKGGAPTKGGEPTPTKGGEPTPTKGGSEPPAPPLGDCETYTVIHGNSSEAQRVAESISVAIYPSSSFANVQVRMDDALYMVCVQGSMLNLTKCNADGDNCEVVDTNSAKRPEALTPHQWNYINITVKDVEIDVIINSNKLMGMVLKNESVANVSVLVDGTDSKVPSDYRALVQYTCESLEQPGTVIPVTRGPGNETHGGTPAPHTDADDGGEEGGPNVGLIVGIIAAVIVVAIIAGVIYSKKVRKSADIHAQTPLQQQQ